MRWGSFRMDALCRLGIEPPEFLMQSGPADPCGAFGELAAQLDGGLRQACQAETSARR